VTPPGPPTRASGSATTTHRGRAPSPRTPATRPLQPSARCSLPPRAHRAAARDGRSARPAWPAWSLSGQARPPRPHPNPARVRHRPPTDLRGCASVARVPASATWIPNATT
jgi:hypothetical protein